jgi:DNA-binding transcriptional LysR family regulator
VVLMLDVKRLRVLREVAVLGSFSGAAASLAYTQSAVSQQIAALERETGTRLLERTPRGVRPTEAGEALVRHAEAVLARLAEAEAELEAIAGLRSGSIRLASFASASAGLVPAAISAFRAQHPSVDVELTLAEPLDGIAQVKAGDVDVALATGRALVGKERLAVVHLLDDPVFVALPRSHRFADRAAIRIEELNEEPFMFGRGNDCPDRELFMNVCRRAGFEPEVSLETDDYNAMQGFVAMGMGVALIPALALATIRDDIVIRPLAGEGAVREILAVSTPGGSRSPATAALLESLAEAAAEIGRAERPALTVA